MAKAECTFSLLSQEAERIKLPLYFHFHAVRFYGVRTESDPRPRASPEEFLRCASRDRTKLPFANSSSLASRCHQSEVSALGTALLMTSRASKSAMESCLIIRLCSSDSNRSRRGLADADKA